jgi:hypothetical protein
MACDQGVANKNIYACKHFQDSPQKHMLKENAFGGSICLEAYARKRIKGHNMLTSM